MTDTAQAHEEAQRAAVRTMLNARSIAIIGATPDTNKLNGRPQHFLMRDGYTGEIWPVNPRYEEIHGRRCYPDIASLPTAPDMAIVAVAAQRAPETVAQLGAKGCPVAVIFSSGFGELGPDGKEVERQLVATARENNIRICGPNTLGFINAFDTMPATFSQYADAPPIAGPVGFASQSGAFGTGISALARSRGLGFGYFVSTGNTSDITPIDCLRAMLDDERIRVLAGYLEGLGDGALMLDLAHEAISRGRPVVVTKVGRNPAGARAAASHTGSLAGEDRVFDGVARQAGIIRARNEEHMLDVLTALVSNPVPSGRGVAILTMSGGAGVLMADRAEEIGLSVPAMSAETRARLANVLPDFGATANPIDVTGQFLADPRIMEDSVRIALEDPQVDVAVVWLQLMHRHSDKLVELFQRIKRSVTKPIIVCWVEAPESARMALMRDAIAVINATERVIDAAAGLIEWGEITRRFASRGALPAAAPSRALASGDARPVATIKAAGMLRAAGLTMVETRLAKSAAEAARIAAEIGFPVVVKIESPDIGHKTEADGVRLGLKDPAAVEKAFADVTAAAKKHLPSARLDGVIVQSMAKPATEMVLGLRRDPVFGHVVMVGLGGIFVEVLKDVVFARAPVSAVDAEMMLDRLVGAAVLAGARGRPPVDRKALVGAIQALGTLAAAHPEIEELDLNPVFAGADGVVAVDWLMTAREVRSA